MSFWSINLHLLSFFVESSYLHSVEMINSLPFKRASNSACPFSPPCTPLFFWLHGECPNLEFFLSVYFHIRTKYEDWRCRFPYSIQMWENTDQDTDLNTFYTVSFYKSCKKFFFSKNFIQYKQIRICLQIYLRFRDAFIT